MKDELLFCPLGGSGEIGMNMNLFCYGKPGDHKWIMVDIGVTFADDSIPGVDLIYPDPGFIVERKDNLLGIILTHAHEDHIGAPPSARLRTLSLCVTLYVRHLCVGIDALHRPLTSDL